MNATETTQKILDFCKDHYPEITWKQESYMGSTIRIWGKADEIDISIMIIGTQLKNHVVLGDVGVIISYKKRWNGSFKIWLDRKESQFSYISKREFEVPIFIKAKEILSNIFEFIETEIQTEETL